ncbi:MAG: phosphatase PAP2 family protein [Ruminococcus sp.]|nr:phosphatase PAP2 family protein [Ruminococcus sp.]
MEIKVTENGYKRIGEFFGRHSFMLAVLKLVYKYLPYPVFVAYPSLLVYLFFHYGIISEEFLKVLFVPAVVFVAVTLFRKICNRQRPYEKYDIKPIVHKEKKGQSFPSRHAASEFIIAMAFLYVSPALGIVLLFVGAVMCVSRVLCGVHFIKDVLVGAALSVLIGYIGFFLL